MKTVLPLLFAIAATMTAAVAGEFPTRVQHVWGETVVPAKPLRVVSVGQNDQDFLYALGIAPVGVREWWGDQPYATWPWAEVKRKEVKAEPAVLKGDLNLEWVLKLEPDLIVATYSDIDEATYSKLSAIAPTIAYPAGFPAWGAPWQTQLNLIDQATSGGNLRAKAIEADLEAEAAAIRARYPQFAGRSATMADMRDGQFTLWDSNSAPTRFLASMGFTFPEDLNARADSAGWIYLSLEQAGILDLDAVVWPNGRRELIEALPIYSTLRLAKEGRSVWPGEADPSLSAALWFQSPLSIAYALDRFAPMLAGALDGDPATQDLPAD